MSLYGCFYKSLHKIGAKEFLTYFFYLGLGKTELVLKRTHQLPPLCLLDLLIHLQLYQSLHLSMKIKRKS